MNSKEWKIDFSDSPFTCIRDWQNHLLLDDPSIKAFYTGLSATIHSSYIQRKIRMRGGLVYTKSLSKVGPSLDTQMYNF